MNYGKNVSALLAAAVVLGSTLNCFADSAVETKTPPYDLKASFNKISPDEIQGNIIKMINSDWMLITAGSEQKFNGMTASWGGIGNWGKPVAFILVHTDRNTYKFLEKEDYFTLSFFDDKYRPALKLFGTKSGRDMDKTKEAGLTGISTAPGIAYAEAKLIIVCKKGFSTMTTKNDPPKGHKLFFGEIVAVWQRK
ncbi:MAG: flavin reductase [Victivallaceae bacterium]|jgi:flavin reductase (DIM6/NTAB) family NADH-FMN oxidoreductase RutF